MEKRHKIAHTGFEGTTKKDVMQGLKLTQKMITYIKVSEKTAAKLSKKKN